jgi:methionyl-tRNA formyltransferase
MAGVKVALAAEDAAGTQALRLITGRGDFVVAVFSGSERGEGTGFETSLRGDAAAAGALVMDAVQVRDPGCGDLLRERGADVLLSVHCRQKIDEALLDAPTRGSFNIHPGPLPEMAGLHPPSWALYEGAREHGVTLHEMIPDLDAGDIVAEARFPVGPEEGAIGLLSQCVRREKELLSALLEDLGGGREIRGTPQDLERRRWFGGAPRELADVDSSWPAEKLANIVRACDYRPFRSPWGSLCAVVRGQRLEVLEAEAAGPGEGGAGEAPGSVRLQRDGSALVATGDGWLRLWEIEVEGAELPASSVLLDGDRLEMFMSGRSSTPGE